MENRPHPNPLLPVLIGLVPVVAYFSFLAIYAVNVPLFDDHALRHFLVKFQAAGTFAEKFALIFSQHNEHRIGFDRLVVLLQFWLTGEINFVGMMVVGNLSLIGILWVFYRVYLQTGRALWGFVPVPYLLFSLALHENTFWGMASLQNFTVLFFALLAIYHLTSSGRNSLLWACASAVAAVYTSGNGFLLLPVGVGLLLLQFRWRDALLFSLLSAVCVTVYFIGYVPPPGNPDQIPLTEIGQYMRGLLLFLGSAADLRPQSSGRFVPILLLGTLLLLFTVALCLQNGLIFIKRTPETAGSRGRLFLTGLLAFLLLTAGVVVYSRLSFGETVLLTSRYRIYSVLFLISTYLSGFSLISKRFRAWLVPGFIALGIFWNVWSIILNLPKVDAHRKEMLTNLFNWTYSQNKVPTTDGYDRRQYPYRRPIVFYNEPAPRWVAPIRPGQTGGAVTSTRPLHIEQTENELIIRDSVAAPTQSIDDGIYLLLKSATRTFLFPTRTTTHTSVRRMLTKHSLYLDGYASAVPKVDIPTDRYTLYLLRHEQGRTSLIHTGEVIRIVNPNREGVKTNW